MSGTRLAELDELIAELTVDAYGDEEQFTGFLTGAEDALQGSEPASIVGVPVTVVKIDAGPDVRRGLTAICERDGARYEVSLVDLAFPADSELGRVTAAYRRWLGCKP
ncbi:MAG TPA: hypothetical protein VED41_00245 [Solirubrobacteraceae bacterium]|nr:hypothetical protein [Solirubrobacteraceae bacterium]